MKAWPAPGVFPMLAHQGGWDELLLVVGPLLLIGLALYVANRRVAAQLATGDADRGAEPPGGGGRPVIPGGEVDQSGHGARPIAPGHSGDGPPGPADPAEH